MHKWLAPLGCLLLLAACAPMEHRSDMPEKQPLSVVQAPVVIQQKWQAEAGNGVGRSDVKLLLVRDNDRLYTVDVEGKVMVFATDTGAVIWTTELNAPVSAGPAIGEGKLVVGTSNGKIIALDLLGNQLWTSTTSSEVLAAPQIVQGMVLVHTMDGGLSAFNAVDGRQLWRFSHNLPPLMLRRSSTPIFVNDKVIAGFANGKVMSLRKQDGAVEWSYDVANPKGRTDLQRMGDISADPVAKNGVVYVISYQGNLVALRADSGQMLWDRDLGSFSGFIVVDDLIYLSGNTGNVYALDARNGDTYWLQTELEGRRLSKPALVGNYIVIGDEDGIVHLLDRNNGARVGYYAVNGKGVEATPIVHNDIVYILGRSGKLVALEVR